MTRSPRSSASCCPPTCSRSTSGCILVAMVLLRENVQCSGMVTAPRPISNPYGAFDAAWCHLDGKECRGVASTDRHRG
ncbi:unnamed protein product, partial [Ectocarpus sp. 13 AM-2016]